MKLQLNIVTHDKKIGYDIAGSDNKLSSGSVVEAAGNIKLEYKCTYAYKALDIPEILEFIVETSKTIDISLFAAWLFDKIKDKQVEKIIINKREITEITKDKIRILIEEEIKINK